MDTVIIEITLSWMDLETIANRDYDTEPVSAFTLRCEPLSRVLGICFPVGTY